MKKLDDSYLVYLRYQNVVFPVSGSAFTKYVTTFMHKKFTEFGLPSIPLVFLEEPPLRLRSSYAWFSYNREENKAVSITVNASLIGGMTICEIKDVLLHEITHYLVLHKNPEMEREENGGHGPLFFAFCSHTKSKPEAGSSHRKVYLNSRPSKDWLTPAREMCLCGNLKLAYEESVDDLPLRTFLCFYFGDPDGVLPLYLDGLKELADQDPNVKALRAWLSLQKYSDEAWQWRWLMAVKDAADQRATLGLYLYGKSLIEGGFGLKSCPEIGLKIVAKAMIGHFKPAMKLWIETLLMNAADEERAELGEVASLIELDIGSDCPTNIEPGGECRPFIPFLGKGKI